MIAEIHGKISRSGSNLSERLEDNLTGQFFGTLRYLPFNIGLGVILSNAIKPNSLKPIFSKMDKTYWDDSITFWPYDSEGEIDVLIEFDEIIIGIEVKYLSGLSSEDSEYSDELLDQIHEMQLIESRNQLARESRIVDKKGRNKRKVLLFIATEPSCENIYNDVIARKPAIIHPDVILGYISWQTIYSELINLSVSESFHQLIIQDLLNLLKRKGFERFESFEISPELMIDNLNGYKFNPHKQELLFEFTTNTIVKGDQFYEFIS